MRLTVVISLRSESNGSSASRGHRSVAARPWACRFGSAASTMAVSVGSPMCCIAVLVLNATEPSQHSAARRSRPRMPSSAVVRRHAPPIVRAVQYRPRTSVMRFCVRVPVLSEQMTEALPSVSTAGRRRMMALLLDHPLHADGRARSSRWRAVPREWPTRPARPPS